MTRRLPEVDYVSLRDVKAMGFGRAAAEALMRRAGRIGGLYQPGRFVYVRRDALERAISESKVRT